MTIYLKRVLSMAALCPVPQKKFTRDILPPVIPAIGTLRARVALFTGCIMDVAAASIHADTAVVLAHNGCEVHLVAGEECCGAVQGHTGDLEGAKIVAKKNMEAFGDSLDAIVVNAAGCGAYLKKYAPLFRDDDKWKDRAQAFSARVRDIQEFLDELGLIPPTKPVPLKAAIQEPCHLVHAQKIPLQTTLRLLRQIPGLTLVPLEGSSDCCGSAGIYNITHFTDSMEVLDKKMKKVSRTGADILLAANPGCLFQLRYGIQRHHLKMEVLHPMTLLAKAYQYEFQGQYT